MQQQAIFLGCVAALVVLASCGTAKTPSANAKSQASIATGLDAPSDAAVPDVDDSAVADAGAVTPDMAAPSDVSAIEVAPPQPPAGMVLIPAGTFWMGCNLAKDVTCTASQGLADEKPQHKVTLVAFYIDPNETTVVQYKACVDAGACTPPSIAEPKSMATYPALTANPVNFVTWAQAQQYCQWRGPGFDLPTEAQWEMAARGSCEENGSAATDPACAKAMRTYPWGEAGVTCDFAVMKVGDNDYGCGTDATWPVGSKPAGDSPYGVHDMAGNVAEWCRDWYGYYSAGALDNPGGLASPVPNSGPSADNRNVRGGSFFAWDGTLRASSRSSSPPGQSSPGVGMRCVRSFDSADPCAGVMCKSDLPCFPQQCINGACVTTAKPNLAPCEDGNACTAAEMCLSGQCVVGAATNCNDGNDCTADSCDPVQGCQHSLVAGGTACGAGNTCDAAGSCKFGGPVGMALIPAGTFWMGCNSAKDYACVGGWECNKGEPCPSVEKPQHKVTLSSYYMDMTEATVAQYKACVDAGACSVPVCEVNGDVASQPTWGVSGKEQNPVNCMSWTQASQYCKWRGAAYDLPTEAQWEMAARGNCEKNGSSASDPGCAQAMRTYPWGEGDPDCNTAVRSTGTPGCGTDSTWRVGSKPAGDSPFGLHDMAGNVDEWVRDWYAATYTAGDQTDPVGPSSGSGRVHRGGDFGSGPTPMRAGSRLGKLVLPVLPAFGMRCVRAYP